MAKRKAIAYLIEYDDAGRTRKRPVRLSATLCASDIPQRFEIILPDKRRTRGRAIMITRAEIERVLDDN